MSFLTNYERVLITGGGGFIGGALIRKLLKESNTKIFNLDKLGYASDLSGIDQTLSLNCDLKERYEFFKVDISN